jgi:hypothetical protein
MALWRKHRFISLEEQDGKDKIAAGSQFVVKRVGSTCVNDLDSTNGEERLKEFYKDLLELFHFEQGCKLRLIVDLSGAVLYSKDGIVLQKFELSNIRDVIYSTTKEEYSRYFILVGREESELTVKAHVLSCEDKNKAKLLYDTFLEVFTLGAEMRKYSRQISDSGAMRDTIKQKSVANSESTNIPKDSTVAVYGRVNTQDVHANMPRQQTWTNSSMTRPRPRTEESQHELNDSFTELARSRKCTSTSSTSTKSDSPDINSNKILWQDSDVFM